MPLLLACWSVPAQPAPPDPLGGLPGSLYVLDIPFLHFGLMAWDLPPPGQPGFELRVDAASTYSHTWHPKAIHSEFGLLGQPFTLEEAEILHERHPHDVISFVVGDVTRVAFRIAWGISRTLSAGLEIPWISYSALSLGGLIQGFHHLFGLYNGEREDFGPMKFIVMRQPSFGPMEYADQLPGSGLGDVTAVLRYRTAVSSDTRLGVDAALKFPTGSAAEFRGSGSCDAGLNVGVAHRLGESRQWGLRSELGLVVPGAFHANGPITIGTAPFFRFLLGGDVRLGTRFGVGLAAVLEQSPARKDHVGDQSRSSLEIDVGLTARLSRTLALQLSLVENVSRLGDAPDLVIGLGLRWLPDDFGAVPARAVTDGGNR